MMDTTYNYSGFIELFLESDEEFEPYGVGISENLEMLESQSQTISTEEYLLGKAILPTLD